MTSFRCYSNSDLDKIHRTRNFGLSLARAECGFNLLNYGLVRCDLYLKLEVVTIEKPNRATLIQKGDTLCYQQEIY